MNPRSYLLESFSVAVKAADPLHIVPQHLPNPPAGRTFVIGAGKAAAAMALAVENAWPVNAQLDGLVITRYGHKLLTHPTITKALNDLPRWELFIFNDE